MELRRLRQIINFSDVSDKEIEKFLSCSEELIKAEILKNKLYSINYINVNSGKLNFKKLRILFPTSQSFSSH